MLSFAGLFGAELPPDEPTRFAFVTDSGRRIFAKVSDGAGYVRSGFDLYGEFDGSYWLEEDHSGAYINLEEGFKEDGDEANSQKLMWLPFEVD